MAIAFDFPAATGGLGEPGDDWMPASGVRHILQQDLCQLWLQFHGARHGLFPDDRSYSFLEFISRKAKEFETKWVREMVSPLPSQVCEHPWQVREAKYVKQTCDLMKARVPVIYQGALWWASECVYGVPDLIVLRSWLFDHFPVLREEDGRPDHYVVIDLKFTSKLDSSEKETDLAIASGQVRICSYMLGHIQGCMPRAAYLITRDRVFDPITVKTKSFLNAPLDPQLATCRYTYADLKLNGSEYLPWEHDLVRPDFSSQNDEPWHAARRIIATERIPGRAPELLYYLSREKALRLKSKGYKSLNDMLAVDPAILPLGSGNTVWWRQWAILHANRDRCHSHVREKFVPKPKKMELFIDYEYMTNVNVDFDAQWPTLEGKEMIFLIGVGICTDSGWEHRVIAAPSESLEGERIMFEQFRATLDELGILSNPNDAALYHWSAAEVWQTGRARERLGSPLSDALGSLSWCDLQKVFTKGFVAIPGQFTYGLKDVATALSSYAPDYAVEWPGELADGLRAMVMGWAMYGQQYPLLSEEYFVLSQYLETDCKALWQILRWLRDNAE